MGRIRAALFGGKTLQSFFRVCKLTFWSRSRGPRGRSSGKDRFKNPWIGRELSGLLAEAGVGGRRQEALWLPTHGFAETDLLFEIGANARRLAPEFPEALAWLESYRAGEAYAGVLMLTCWGRKI
jgi:hypothetical protein